MVLLQIGDPIGTKADSQILLEYPFGTKAVNAKSRWVLVLPTKR